jgi:hypothetical protein
MNDRDIAIQQISLLAHVEHISERENLLSPVTVHIIDRNGMA